MQDSPAETIDPDALASFASKLEDFAATRSGRERRMLAALVLASLDPVERMRWLAPADLLSAREEAYLRTIEAELTEGS